MKAFPQRIVQSRAAAHANAPEGARKPVTIVGKVLSKQGNVWKQHEEDVVISVDGSDEAVEGASGRVDFPFHAAARVQRESYANR